MSKPSLASRYQFSSGARSATPRGEWNCRAPRQSSGLEPGLGLPNAAERCRHNDLASVSPASRRRVAPPANVAHTGESQRLGSAGYAKKRHSLGDHNSLNLIPHRETAMSLATLHDLMVHELKDLYSAERQLLQALPKMAKNANSDQLQTAIDNHLSETEVHVSRLEHILQSFDESPKGQKCHGMEGLIEEGKNLLKEDADPDVMDAGIIGAAQRVEHYEIAAYGCLRTYAELLGMDQAVRLLQQTLEEEEAADKTLTQLGESGINEAAAAVGVGSEDEE